MTAAEKCFCFQKVYGRLQVPKETLEYKPGVSQTPWYSHNNLLVITPLSHRLVFLFLSTHTQISVTYGVNPQGRAVQLVNIYRHVNIHNNQKTLRESVQVLNPLINVTQPLWELGV